MSYKLLEFKKEKRVDGSVYIALVEKEGYEQPFKIVLEHFETGEQAEKQVEEWILRQQADDDAAVKNKEEEELATKQDSVIDKLNKDL